MHLVLRQNGNQASVSEQPPVSEGMQLRNLIFHFVFDNDDNAELNGCYAE